MLVQAVLRKGGVKGTRDEGGRSSFNPAASGGPFSTYGGTVHHHVSGDGLLTWCEGRALSQWLTVCARAYSRSPLVVDSR